MAPGSELAANKVGPTWEVGPTEDVIQALMETLVDPLLPLSVTNVSPQEDDQKSVAKQMHAVVLLYNYHHRKQKTELRFLDFSSFCKLAVVVKPPLVSFMNLMMDSESDPMKSNTADNHQLSLTEKAIKDACDIALALDAESEIPKTEGWPISKVAVLLIDSKKENCMLRFGDVTKGVWSVIEKEVDESKIDRETLLEEKIGEKRKRDGLSSRDDEFLQLGYDAVKDVTGISSTDLQVLATHVTYSLSNEKSAVCFYMMQCSESFDVKEEASLKFLVESLQGPLAEKFDYGFWRTTTVVEFYHVLPYVEFISSWLSRKESCLPSLNGCIGQSTTTTCKKYNDSSVTKVNSSDKIASENYDKNDTDNLDKGRDIFDSTINKKSRVNLEISNTDNEKTATDDSVIEKSNNKKSGDVAHSAKMEERGKYREILDKESDDRDEDAENKSEDGNKKLSSKIRVYHHRRKNNSSAQNDTHVRENGANLKVVNEDKGDVTISLDQNGVAEKENRLIQFDSKAKCNLELQNVSASEELKNALSLLYMKRQELYSQICDMEDTLAFCENDIAGIRDGGDVGLARECIESILSGNYHSMPEHGTRNHDNGESQREKRIRLSEIYLLGKSSCQDLEYTCLKNNWRLPRYLIEPSDGKFVSSVFVQGKDIALRSKGGVESKPREARESAAAQMFAKLRKF